MLRGVGARDPARDGPAAARRPLWIGRAIVAATVLAVFVTLLLEGGGVSGRELETAWQLLDLQVLGDDPVGSVWYLHTQPPLHNLVVGIVAWTPLPLAGTLFVLYAASLLVTGLALHALLVRWQLPPVPAGAVVALALASPSLPNTVRIVSYEIPVAMLVVGTLWAIQRYLDEPALRWLLAVSALATLGVLTRSLLHPVWLLAILALVLVARPVAPRHLAAAAAIPLVLVGGWMVKNQALFDTATTSSWLGFNLQRGVTGPMQDGDVEAAVRDGTVSSQAVLQPWLGVGDYAGTTGGCRPRHVDPATARPVKQLEAGGEISNFNAECFLPAYEQAQRDAMALVRRSPRRYVETRAPSLAMTYQRVGSGWDLERNWMDALYAPALVEVDYHADMRDWNLPLLPVDELPIRSSLTLAACTVVVVARAALAAVRLARRGWRSRADWPAEEVVWIVAGWTVVVIVLGSSLVEFGENSRFRSSVDPLLIALPLAALIRRARARRPAEPTGEEGEERAAGAPHSPQAVTAPGR